MNKLRPKTDGKTHRFVSPEEPLPFIVTVRFTEEDGLIMASYARNYGMTTSEFMRRAMLEKTAHVPILEGRYQ